MSSALQGFQHFVAAHPVISEMFGMLLTREKYLHNPTSLLRVEVWDHQTNLIPLLLIHASHDLDMCVRPKEYLCFYDFHVECLIRFSNCSTM